MPNKSTQQNIIHKIDHATPNDRETNGVTGRLMTDATIK